ncbi:MAG: hypothetical protein MUC30_07245, partial [Bacteroidales bacterium]|nr:hypothetical protein [Bacteroidales bacterium]
RRPQHQQHAVEAAATGPAAAGAARCCHAAAADAQHRVQRSAWGHHGTLTGYQVVEDVLTAHGAMEP